VSAAERDDEDDEREWKGDGEFKVRGETTIDGLTE